MAEPFGLSAKGRLNAVLRRPRQLRRFGGGTKNRGGPASKQWQWQAGAGRIMAGSGGDRNAARGNGDTVPDGPMVFAAGKGRRLSRRAARDKAARAGVNLPFHRLPKRIPVYLAVTERGGKGGDRSCEHFCRVPFACMCLIIGYSF